MATPTWLTDVENGDDLDADFHRNNLQAIERSWTTPSWVADGAFNIWPNEVLNTDSALTDQLAHWTLAGTGATMRRTGPAAFGLDDSNTYGLGFAAKVVRGSAHASLSQTLLSASGFPTYYRGRRFVAACGVKTATADAVRLELYDGAGTPTVGNGYSTYHTGSNLWEWLIVQRDLDAAADRLQLRLWTEGSGATISYLEGACGVWGYVPPASFVPCPAILGTLGFRIIGPATVGTFRQSFNPARPFIVRDTFLHAKTGPVSSALILDVNQYDGAAFQSMYTSGARPQIAAGASAGSSQPDGSYKYRCFTGGFGTTIARAVLNVDVDAIGSGGAGSDVAVAIRAMQFQRPQESLLAYDVVG